jgi:uncharacterized protein (TIGR01777 family)
MKIVIAGGTGFLGRPLTTSLLNAGHSVVLLSRHPDSRIPRGARGVAWDPEQTAMPWAAELGDAGVVINLAGVSIDERRWSAARKRAIENSRVTATSRLVAAIVGARRAPPLLISGSGIGFYGSRGSEIVTEETGAGDDFLAGVCLRWEAEAAAASAAGTRVVCVRTGLVLAGDGGALARMLLPFRLGIGGRLGSGRQYWPWIHRADWVDLVRFAIDTPALAGPLNAAAPNPVTNAEFTATLARVLHRPAIVPVPAFALRLAIGELAAAVLTGQRAVPAKADRLGFRFSYPTIEPALTEIAAG